LLIRGDKPFDEEKIDWDDGFNPLDDIPCVLERLNEFGQHRAV
jgi:hypothetical protein